MSGFSPELSEVTRSDDNFAGSLYSYSGAADEVQRHLIEDFGWDEDVVQEYVTSDVARLFAQLCAVALRTRTKREQREQLAHLDITVGGGGSSNSSNATRHDHDNWYVDPQTPHEAVCWTANCQDCDHKLMVTIG